MSFNRGNGQRGSWRGCGNRNHRGNFNQRSKAGQYHSFEDILNAMNVESKNSLDNKTPDHSNAFSNNNTVNQEFSGAKRERGFHSRNSNDTNSKNTRKSGASEENLLVQKYMSRIKINTPEDLAKWIQERKKNYPTDANIEKKAVLAEQKAALIEEKIKSTPKLPNQIGLNYSDSESESNQPSKALNSELPNKDIPISLNSSESLSVSEQPEVLPVNVPIPDIKIPKRKTCSYFQNGRCARGNKCNMIHNKPTRLPKLHKHGDLYSMLRESESKLNAPALLQVFRLLNLYSNSNQKT